MSSHDWFGYRTKTKIEKFSLYEHFDNKSDESLILNVSFVLNSRNEAIEVTNMFLELCPEFIASKITGT